MAINGEISIFRFTTSGTTETATSDKVEFNGDAIIPDEKSFIQTIKPIMSLVGQENDTPDSNNPSLLDETGLAFVGLEIVGYFKGNESLRPFAINTLRNWMQADKTNSDFPFGRFGIRNDIDGDFDLVPTATEGYILEYFDVVYDYTNRDYKFLIKLRFNGDITSLPT